MPSEILKLEDPKDGFEVPQGRKGNFDLQELDNSAAVHANTVRIWLLRTLISLLECGDPMAIPQCSPAFMGYKYSMKRRLWFKDARVIEDGEMPRILNLAKI